MTMPRCASTGPHSSSIGLALSSEVFGTNRGDGFLKGLHAIDQPGQFLVADFVSRRIARADIGAIEACKAALGETVIARPYVDELRSETFSLRTQKDQPVRFGAVERQDEQGAMIEAFGRLMQ